MSDDPSQEPQGETAPDAPAAPAAVDAAPAAVDAAPAEADTAPDVPPDRLAISPRSPFYDADLLMRGIGIRFKDVRRHNVEEYCVSEGWVRVQAGRAMDRKGNPLTLKLNGTVEAWFEDLGDDAPVARLAS